jgi:hypothetical protein
MGLNFLFDPAFDPASNRFGLLFRVIEGLDLRDGSIEHRYSAAPIFGDAVHIG